VETNPPRNSRLRLIRTDEGREWARSLLPVAVRHRTDRSPMPQKTHPTSCGAAASMFLALSCASNSAGGR